MNILLVHNFYQQPGGEDQVFAEEASLLERHGNTVARFTMDNDAISGMGKLAVARKTIWNRDAQHLLRAAIRDVQAQVVHFHNTFPLVSPAAYYTAHEQGAAVVQTLHNYRLLCPAAILYRDGKICEQCLHRDLPWPGVVHACYRNSRLATATIAAMLGYHRFKQTWFNEVDLYIALTNFARDKFIAGMALPSDKVAVKPNFVDPDPGMGSGDGDYILFVGRLTPEKGVQTLLDAWIPLCKNTGWKLKVAGDGPLRELVTRAARPDNRIEFVGRRPLTEIYAMMGGAQAVVFPSQWYEGQPRTILESFAKGTPVVSSRLGSMSELIDHQRTGLLFEPGDPQDLARQVQHLWELDHDERRRMRQVARLEFESRYTASANYPAMLQCYQTALDARTGPLLHKVQP